MKIKIHLSPVFITRCVLYSAAIAENLQQAAITVHDCQYCVLTD